MISWIQNTFQHHFKIVFAILLALVIVAFVFTIGAAPGIGNAEQNRISRQFFDLNLSTSEGQQRLVGDANLSAYLTLGYGGIDGEQLQMYALQRYAALSMANELRIPAPTSAELTTYLKGLRAFASEKGEFDPVAYERFKGSLKTNPRLRETDVARIMNADFRVNRVQSLLSGPGYVQPADIRQQIARADTIWTLAVASISYESFAPAIAPSDADLNKYFEDNIFRYEIQPRFSGQYLEFSMAGYLGQVQVTDAEVKAFYDSNPARFPAVVKEGAPKLEGAAAFAAVKSQVETSLKIERARRMAQKIASDVTVALFEKQATPATITALLAERGLVAKNITPFSRDEPPAEFGGQPEIAAEAFKMGKDRIFSDALATPNGAIVLIWNETIPARKPILAEVKNKVVADYTEIERRKRFVELGKSLKATIANRVQSGESITAAAEAATAGTNVNAEIKTLSPFPLTTPPQDPDYAILAAVENLNKGDLSDMSISGPKGVLVYAADKKLPEIAENNERFLMIRAQMARMSGSTAGSSMLNEIVQAELKKSAPTAR